MLKTVIELFKFLVERKKFWMIPIIFIFILMGGLMILTEGTAVSPFIYTLF